MPNVHCILMMEASSTFGISFLLSRRHELYVTEEGLMAPSQNRLCSPFCHVLHLPLVYRKTLAS